MSGPQAGSLLERLIEEARVDDYALAGPSTGRSGRRGVIVAAVVFAMIGLVLGAAITQQDRSQPAAEQRRADLVARIEQQRESVNASEAQAAALRSSVSQLQRLATGGLSKDFADQLQAVEVATGFVPLAGPGAVVTMQDARPPLPKGVEPGEARVLDVDMQLAVNGLWQAGAQAIAINDIRLTSSTAIRTAGEAILVDYRPLVPPYRITALGPADLADRFNRSKTSQELDSLRNDYGIATQVAAVEQARVPASSANLPIRADVVRGDE